MDKRFYLTEDEKRRILGLHQNPIKKNRINEVEVRDIQKQIEDLGGYVGQKGADNKLGPDTLNAIYNYLSKMNPIGSKLTDFKGPETVDGSEETFDAPVQTVGTTPTAATPTSATTTSATTTSATTTSAAATTAKTPTTTQNPDLLADLKTASQIRQEFRQGKKDKNKATRHYNQMVNKYNRLKSKMSPQDNTAYLQAMSQLKQQMETLSKENYN